MKNTTQTKVKDIKQRMLHNLGICVLLFSVIEIPFAIQNNVTIILAIGSILFAVMAIIISIGLGDLSINKTQTAEDIRLIEQSLVNFYRPLHNLFYGQDGNPINTYERNKKSIMK